LKDAAVTVHPAFDVVDDSFIDEYGLRATTYKHKKSGAEVLSVIAPEDNNKVFGVVFRTPPEDSTGLPHILEHSVLCGSRKFKTKEPFVDLIKGSLNTFLNAFTYPDRTCYPVASVNLKDFYNLIDVYLDAVLHPRALDDPQVLQQEGWHFELEDPSKPLEYKGVVYNEMKGVYSSPDSLLSKAAQEALFPDNTYGVDSGGDPRKIIDLDFQKFKDFHSKYYHPSNARAYFYGDDDPLKRLEILDGYFSEFDEIEVDSTIKFQKKIDELKRVEVSYPVQDGDSAKHIMTVNWMLHEGRLTAEEAITLQILNDLLIGRSSSPLRKALIESGLGESLSGGGLSDELLQATYSIGLKGVEAENVPKIEALINEQIERLAKEGFHPDDITACVNSLEFSLREFNTGGFPKGLSLMIAMFSKWNYDEDPTSGVRFEKGLKEFKDDIAAGKPVFQDMLNKFFVSNKHKVIVDMKPDTELEKINQEWEETVLKQAKETMSSADIEEVIDSTKKLKAAQLAEDSPEARATIPKLALEDIEREVKVVPIEVDKSIDGVTILTHDLETSGILYTDIGFDASSITEEDLVLMPLFTQMLTETGTKDLDEAQLLRRIDSETGGVSFSFSQNLKGATDSVADLDDPLLHIMTRGKATKDKVPELLSIIRDILFDARLDNKKRAVEMLKQMKSNNEMRVIGAGHAYASSRVGAHVSLNGYISEATGGLTYIRNLGKLLEEAENDWPKIQARLETLREKIMRKGGLVINLTGNKALLEDTRPAVDEFLGKIPAAGPKNAKLAETWSKSKLLTSENEGFTMPSQVNYVVKGAQIFKPGEKIKGSYSVASRFLSTGYLWDNVRVVGGAYGGSASLGTQSGVLSFFSYRDPNLGDTLSIYDNAAEALTKEVEELDDERLVEAIIGMVGGMDAPQNADGKGYTSMIHYITGRTTEDRQRFRNEVLATSKEDFLEFAEKLKTVKDHGITAVFGSQAAFDAANEALPEGKKLDVQPYL
jgi:Zn-dependent M16 (insulinase) family peptidase